MKNVGYYLTETLQRLTARKVRLEISQSGLVVEPDRSHRVFEISVPDLSKDPTIDDAIAEAVCGVDSMEDRCIFSTGQPGSYICTKFNSLVAQHVLDAHAQGNLRLPWRRIGDCALSVLKREETREVTQR